MLTIFGDTYPTREGTGKRDYVQVMDVAQTTLGWTSHHGLLAICADAWRWQVKTHWGTLECSDIGPKPLRRAAPRRIVNSDKKTQLLSCKTMVKVLATNHLRLKALRMSDSYETLLLEIPSDMVLLITLNRPQASNAFNTQMARELVDVFEDIALAPNQTRAIIVTGAGQKAFCAGGDLKERHGMTDAAWGAQHLIYERMARSVLACPVPVIGAINGAAYGGGCELAAAFDFIYVSETARFAQTETKIGIIPGAGGTQTLSRAIGERRAKELILSGRVFSAQQALDWGLANGICAPENLLETTLSVACEIASNAPVAVRQAKQAIHNGLQMGLANGLAFEIEAYSRTVPTQDRREGVAAFNEKRKPRFTGK